MNIYHFHEGMQHFWSTIFVIHQIEGFFPGGTRMAMAMKSNIFRIIIVIPIFYVSH